jgi:hypothetical protein
LSVLLRAVFAEGLRLEIIRLQAVGVEQLYSQIISIIHKLESCGTSGIAAILRDSALSYVIPSSEQQHVKQLGVFF